MTMLYINAFFLWSIYSIVLILFRSVGNSYVDIFFTFYRPEMVVGWYHSHPGFGCWLSGVDINTQQVYAYATVLLCKGAGGLFAYTLTNEITAVVPLYFMPFH